MPLSVILALAMTPHRPLNTTIGVLIVGLVTLALVVSFVSDGGVQYYIEAPVRVLSILGFSSILGGMIWLAARRLPKFLPFSQVLSVLGLTLGLTVGAVLCAYTTLRFWFDDGAVGTLRWAGAGFATALGVLAVASWREYQAASKTFRQLDRNGQPGTAPIGGPAADVGNAGIAGGHHR